MQAFEIQVLNGGGWTTVSANTGNNLPSTRFSGPAVAGTAIRIHMTKALGSWIHQHIITRLLFIRGPSNIGAERWPCSVPGAVDKKFTTIACMRLGAHPRYAIKEVRVLSSAARAVVQDCGEAEQNSDARDKFFM